MAKKGTAPTELQAFALLFGSIRGEFDAMRTAEGQRRAGGNPPARLARRMFVDRVNFGEPHWPEVLP